MTIISLLGVSFALIYKEAFCRPMLCDTYEQECRECDGSFYIWDCRECSDGLIHCQWRCEIPYPCPWLCDWPCGVIVEGDDCVL
mgnify:CR=1 FL=1